MGATGRRVGSRRLRAIENEAIVDGVTSKSTKPLAEYFGAPRESQGKAKPGGRAVVGGRT